jgi:hypothetical protein
VDGVPSSSHGLSLTALILGCLHQRHIIG